MISKLPRCDYVVSTLIYLTNTKQLTHVLDVTAWLSQGFVVWVRATYIELCVEHLVVEEMSLPIACFSFTCIGYSLLSVIVCCLDGVWLGCGLNGGVDLHCLVTPFRAVDRERVGGHGDDIWQQGHVKLCWGDMFHLWTFGEAASVLSCGEQSVSEVGGCGGRGGWWGVGGGVVGGWERC